MGLGVLGCEAEGCGAVGLQVSEAFFGLRAGKSHTGGPGGLKAMKYYEGLNVRLLASLLVGVGDTAIAAMHGHCNMFIVFVRLPASPPGWTE